jgi:hypothetical protein
MEIRKCYYASFNAGSTEFWKSEIYLDENSVLLEIEEETEKIAEQLSQFSFVYSEEDEETFEMLKRAICSLKEYKMYQERESDLEFFILEQPVWENYEYKIKYGFNQ